MSDVRAIADRFEIEALRGEVGRPDIPGYGIRPDGEGILPWSFVDERMANARNYWVATTRPDGRPHAMPLSGVWIDGSFCFGTGPGSRKARNLAENPHLVVHSESGDEVVILEAVAELVADPVSLDGAFRVKYGIETGDVDDVWYALRPVVAFAWVKSNYHKTATRWRFGGDRRP
jgi:hypothetical protein